MVGLCTIYAYMRAASSSGAEACSRNRLWRRPPTATSGLESHGRCPCSAHQAGARPSEAADPAALAWRLGHPAGAGITGTGAAGFLRAVLVELLDTGSDRFKVVIGRAELNRLFGDHVDDVPWRSFFPRLQVCELLEDAIEHLETEIWMTEAEITNSDLLRGDPRKNSRTYWFATPGADSDVVLQALQSADSYNLAGLMVGLWPHGRTYTLGDEDPLLGTAFAPTQAVPLMTTTEAVSRLHAAVRGSQNLHSGRSCDPGMAR
ncbi:hypothetical protein SAMN04489712_1439 [Thermomonospora echinospora]|uniref:Uncharacterized protein n=1 Tax=Thermomonospora echinospora TaxID=1992 RepID=A0A1H6E8E4_9ACTN|nr:hypothetical protein SAMN04489712_1439 [Thermomonospora echinospora]